MYQHSSDAYTPFVNSLIESNKGEMSDSIHTFTSSHVLIKSQKYCRRLSTVIIVLYCSWFTMFTELWIKSSFSLKHLQTLLRFRARLQTPVHTVKFVCWHLYVWLFICCRVSLPSYLSISHMALVLFGSGFFNHFNMLVLK